MGRCHVSALACSFSLCATDREWPHGLYGQVWMGEDESIAGLKARLQPLTGVPAAAQKLMFKRLLKDTDVIRDTIQVCCSMFFYVCLIHVFL